jgi:hypothetical protein
MDERISNSLQPSVIIMNELDGFSRLEHFLKVV